ncbi:response regulator, partial [Salmonella enterica subsp. enterica serovar Virginia]|nr:response regulator [Salmonella enterica subsp. enterica serovar Virginia]
TRKPDLIILDLGLPDGDGIDFIRDLRQWSAIPVIVLSARSEDISIEGLMEHIPGPDFPTAAIINGRRGIEEAYRTGRGKVYI